MLQLIREQVTTKTRVYWDQVSSQLIQMTNKQLFIHLLAIFVCMYEWTKRNVLIKWWKASRGELYKNTFFFDQPNRSVRFSGWLFIEVQSRFCPRQDRVKRAVDTEMRARPCKSGLENQTHLEYQHLTTQNNKIWRSATEADFQRI